MNRYFLKTLGAQILHTPTLYLLTILGVALGVASVVGIQLLNRSAIGAFEGGVRAISGDADLTILGRTGPFPEEIYPTILAQSGVADAWPIHRSQVALAGHELFFLEVVGFDLFSPIRIPWEGYQGDLAESLRVPGWVAVTPELAGEMGWKIGDSFEVSIGTRRAVLRIGALVDFRSLTPLASRKLAVMDIAQAQNLFGKTGRVHQIDLRAAGGTDLEDLRNRLRHELGPGFRILTRSQRRTQAEGLLRAFRLNLTALSLVSLFVGMFLIYGSTQASLVRRRREFGILRSLGATPADMFRLILSEVILLGLIGVSIGIPLGRWAATENIESVSRTVSNLYLLSEIESIDFSWPVILLALGIGIGGAVAGAIYPALETCRRDPRTLLAPFTLQERLGSAGLPLLLAGLAMPALAGIWYVGIGRTWKPAGFVLGAAVLLALPMVTPFVVRHLTGRMRAGDFGFRHSWKNLGARLHNSSIAVAALAIAVSMLIGITLMIGAFRKTVEVWIHSSIQADIYVSTESSLRAGAEAEMDGAIVNALAAHPGVRTIDKLRRIPVQLEETDLSLVGVIMDLPGGQARFPLLGGDRAEVMRRVVTEGEALISEPLANQRGIGPGDLLELIGPGGETAFQVAGVYSDYTTERGVVAIDLETMRRRFGPGPIQYVALYLEAGQDPEAVVDEIRARFPASPLRIRSNRQLRENSLRVFDQTFAVTRLLQLMSLLIAVSGITLSLIVQVRERVSELALYRSLGAYRTQIFRVFVGEGLGMGLLGLGLGLLGGTALAVILIRIVNRAYFGWTIHLYWPWAALGREALMILTAAAIAGLYPAFRASRTPATELSREDLV